MMSRREYRKRRPRIERHGRVVYPYKKIEATAGTDRAFLYACDPARRRGALNAMGKTLARRGYVLGWAPHPKGVMVWADRVREKATA